MENGEAKSSYMASIEIKQAFAAAEEAVKQGRALLLDYFGKNHNVQNKEKAGLVSDADKNSEALIKGILKKACPDFDFLGEESDYEDEMSAATRTAHKPSKKPRWILDPLDGTTNYLHQLPMWAISLALEVDEEIQIGIVDIPMMNQTFTAIRGQGAFCNGIRLKVSECQKLEDAFMTTGFVADHPEVLSEQLKIFEHFVWKAQAIRRPGAAAYDLAMVAAGNFDVYWEKNIKPWDVAAGILLVEEARGKCANYGGQKYDAFQKDLIAGTPKVVDLFVSDLKNIKR
jgi:myo-inositol-1(or 4)-monophosphatase